jgi:hypothetical protein
VPFPQTFQNRTRTQAQAELVEYVGGVGQSDALTRAGEAWDAAVREFNTVAWRFNTAQQDIALVNNQQTYTLNDFFQAPLRAKLVDPNGKERTALTWFPYAEWLVYRPSQLTGASQPYIYTAQNTYQTGLVTLDPFPVAPFTYPTFRIFYLTYIQLQPTAGLTLNVPPDVDEAIFQLAVAKLIAKNKRFGGDSEQAMALALRMRAAVERNYRSWGEITQRGTNG